ncbi:MAG TPA: tripartite tricarboxylate transporter substrate-binding protein [Burkholderiales bacterium]|nr:tripartite tricarboxylate transporter substrate-binding protein [Burkholderiales bacterium]
MRHGRTLVALALSGFAASTAAQGWMPRRSVELVVGFAAGGSQDLTARTVERLLVANKLTNVPIAVVNKAGAGGSVAYGYVSQRPGDGHTLMVAGTSLLSGHILGTNPFDYTDFTPIASLFNDSIVFSVNAASPLRTGKYPRRLKSMIGVNARDVEEAVQEVKRWSGSKWAVGVYVNLPIDYPLDHPDLHPLWRAMDEEGLCYIHHSFAEGYPGYRDLWRNPFLGRSASHPWGAMRAMGAFFGAGLLDRYPNLRFAVLESGFGWIPFWAVRMEDQAKYMGFVAEGLKHTMLEYTTGGRFFASIVLHEGGRMVKMVSEFLGDHLLMFSTDYPHPESRFPESVDLALGWKEVNAGLMRKILWDNAVSAFGEP